MDVFADICAVICGVNAVVTSVRLCLPCVGEDMSVKKFMNSRGGFSRPMTSIQVGCSHVERVKAMH